MVAYSPMFFEGGAADLVVDTGERRHRIQLKSRNPWPNQSHRVVVNLIDGQRRGYTRDEIDALVVYIPLLDTFVWLGIERVEGATTVNLFQYRKKRRHYDANYSFLIDDHLW